MLQHVLMGRCFEIRSLWAAALAWNTGGIFDLLAEPKADASKVAKLGICGTLLISHSWCSLYAKTISQSRLMARMLVGNATLPPVGSLTIASLYADAFREAVAS